MADVQNVETRFYVGRINKPNATVEIIAYDEWNGLFMINSIATPQYAFPEQRQANILVNSLNNFYDEIGADDYRCYLLRNVENLTHVVGDIDENFKEVFNRYFNIDEDGNVIEPTPEGDAPEE